MCLLQGTPTRIFLVRLQVKFQSAFKLFLEDPNTYSSGLMFGDDVLYVLGVVDLNAYYSWVNR